MNEQDFSYPEPEDLDNNSYGSSSFGSGAPSKPKRHGRLIVIIAVVLVVILVGAGGFWYWRNRTYTHSAAKTSQTSSSQTDNSTSSASATSAISHYVAKETGINLSFDYPSNWTVSPTSTTGNGSQPITVTSPHINTTNASGAQTLAKVVITIRPAGSQISELSNATAAQTSIQIGYNHPTPAQHQYPYISFVHLTGGTNTDGVFEEVFITGANSFPQNSPIGSADLANIDPLISARFYSCSSSCDGTSAENLSITTNTWNTDPLFKQVLSIFQSFQIN